MNTERILFVVPGPISWATSRFRAYWISEHFPNSEVVLLEDIHKQVDLVRGIKWDVAIWLKFVDVEEAGMLRSFGTMNMWDSTDPVWWFDPDAAWPMLEATDFYSFSSKGLMEDFKMWCGRSGRHLPDTMKLEHYAGDGPRHIGPARKLIWFGHVNNRLSMAGPMINLNRLYAEGHEFELTIMDNLGDKGVMFEPPFPIHRVTFDVNTEAEILRAHDLAILPEYPGPWGKVKSNNKELTAYACGLAYSPGMTYNLLLDLVVDGKRRQANARSGRKMLEERYTTKHGANNLRELLRSVL